MNSNEFKTSTFSEEQTPYNYYCIIFFENIKTQYFSSKLLLPKHVNVIKI